jgi:hypothetical protein
MFVRGQSHDPSSSVGGWSVNSSHRQVHCVPRIFIGSELKLDPMLSAKVVRGTSLVHSLRNTPHGELKGVVCGFHNNSKVMLRHVEVTS